MNQVQWNDPDVSNHRFPLPQPRLLEASCCSFGWKIRRHLLNLLICLVLFSSPASLLMPSSASTAIASSDSLSSGISSTLVPSPSTSLIFTTVRTQDSSTVSLSNTQTSSVWSSGVHVNSSTTVSPARTSSTNLIRPTTSSLGVKASASPGKFCSNGAMSRVMSHDKCHYLIRHLEFYYFL